MGKKKPTSSKSKEILVDEEVSLSVIENQDFVAMRATEKIWPSPSTMEDQLRELVSDDFDLGARLYGLEDSKSASGSRS
jgi:hypothetical protein